MPNSNLPPDNYLGDPSRITSEFQDAIDDLQNWVNTLQSELNALSGTTVQEGAVRSATSDTTAGNLVLRDSNGRAQFADPSAAQDGVTKSWGNTVSNFDWYEEARIEADNDFDAGQYIRFVRVGKLVTVTSEEDMDHTNGSSATTSSGFVPSSMRPIKDTVSNIYEFDGTFIRRVYINTFGELILQYRDYSGALKSNNFGGGLFSITYITD